MLWISILFMKINNEISVVMLNQYITRNLYFKSEITLLLEISLYIDPFNFMFNSVERVVPLAYSVISI